MRSFLLSLAIVLSGCMATRSVETTGLDPTNGHRIVEIA